MAQAEFRRFPLDGRYPSTRMWTLVKRVLWAAMLACCLSGAESGATEMAVTIDDLPTHGPMPPGVQRVAIGRDMISVLKRRGVREAYGFVNGGQVKGDPQHSAILKMWHQAGLGLGNHTFSHPNLNRVTASEYIADIERNEAVLAEVAGPRWERIFRYPYLHEGDTLQKRDAVRRWLTARGYQIAQVTVYFDDWAWNDAPMRDA